MMVTAKTEYYNLEKVAEVLSVSTAEVNRLREQSKLRGFRDGTTWKFQKEDVHTYLAETIKARSGNASNGKKPGESDFDIMNDGGSSSSFDLLVENADSLPHDSQLLSVSPQTHPASDLDLAALDNNDDDLSLAEETRISAVPVMAKPKKSKASKSGVIQDEEDSDVALALSPASKSDAVLLDDNESVLGGSGSSPQLGLAGDSGFDVLVGGDDDSDLLEVDEEKTAPVFAPAEEFSLEPTPKVADIDDSDSSSQVIAIDGGFAGIETEPDPFGQGFETADFGGFDAGIQQPVADVANDPFGQTTATFPDTFSTSAPSVSVKKAPVREEEYSKGVLIALVCVLAVMLLPGMMLVDTMAHMWSMNENSPFVLNSVLMNMISGWFGL